jgi:hypothetical protein
MSLRETDRFALHLKLIDVLGDDMAEVLMEHLPPSGWGDVARKSDIDFLSTLMDAKFDAVAIQFESVDKQFENVHDSLRGLQHGLWALTSLMSACFIATFTILATQL